MTPYYGCFPRVCAYCEGELHEAETCEECLGEFHRRCFENHECMDSQNQEGESHGERRKKRTDRSGKGLAA